MQDKKTIRKTILRMRNNIPADYKKEAERKISQKLLSMEFFIEANAVMCYADICGEVSTADIMQYCIDNGKAVSLPQVLCKGKMTARRITCPDLQLQNGHYGIPEPICSLTAESDPGKFDIIILPGVAFGRDMHRIGYGEGFYDNYLKKTGRDSIRVGLAFDLQILDILPADENDEPVDLIITESEIIGRMPDAPVKTRNGGIT